MNKKFIVVLLGILSLSACAKTETKNITHNYILPDELVDCSISSLSSESSQSLVVVRCPNSSTSTNYSVTRSTGKTSVTDYYSNVIIDGVEYQKVEKKVE